MDPSDFRRQFEEELSQAHQPEGEFRDLLSRSPSAAESVGLRAGLDAGMTTTEGALATALAVVRDRASDAELRASALQVIGLNITAQPDLFDGLLEAVQDRSLPVDARLAVLATVQELSFRMVEFPTKRSGYLATLRALVDDPDATLRRRVIGILAREKDEYVQRRLLDGLEGRAKPLVSAAKAIQFLGYDVHAEHFPVLRRIVENPPTAAAKREAVRLLAADPSSVDLLASILADKSERADVRRISALALQAAAPERFEEQARDIVLDQAEDDQLRAVAITALGYFGTTPAATDTELTRRVQQLQSESTSRQVKAATRVFMAQRGAS